MKQCKDCYYYDACNSSESCNDYSPVEEEISDTDIEELIDERRIEFQEEWTIYIREFND